MAITNSVAVDGSNSLWAISAYRGEYSIGYSLSLTDDDRQLTSDERDTVALAVGTALTNAGLTSVIVNRIDVAPTRLN